MAMRESDAATMPHPCYIHPEALKGVGASALDTLQPAPSPPMASPKRPKSATSSTRKNTARKRAAETPAASSTESSDELRRRIQDPEEPLSFLPAEHRSAAAERRVFEQLFVLLNAINQASNYVGVDVRPTFLTMLNVTSAMIAMARNPTADLSAKAVDKALQALERGALKVIKELAPDDEVPLLPSEHYDLDRRYNLISSKLALLDVVASALEGRVHLIEQDTEVRLDTRDLDKAIVTKMPKDNVRTRAERIARHINCALITNIAFAKLLVRPAFPMSIREDHRRLSRVIRKLMKMRNATIVQVARAVLYAFGASSKSLKNAFSSKLIEEWEAARQGSARRDDELVPL